MHHAVSFQFLVYDDEGGHAFSDLLLLALSLPSPDAFPPIHFLMKLGVLLRSFFSVLGRLDRDRER